MDKHLLFELPEMKKIHLGVTGSIAAYKSIELMRALQKAGVEVSVTLTDSAMKFISPLTFESLGAKPVYKGMFDEPLSHLAPTKDADAFVIAPASADTIAQIALGRADSLLAAQALAFPKQLVIAPAMNPHMWSNPATQDNVSILKSRGVIFIGPDKGKVACNDDGEGRLASDKILFLKSLKSVVSQDLAGKKILITLGATREYFDSVRYWTNGSTGMMGMCFALSAWLRGAEVHAVCGENVTLYSPDDELFHRHVVGTASEMLDTSAEYWNDMDYGIFTAAVADFSPEKHTGGKFKKSLADEGFSLRFYPNQDILKLLAGEKQAHQKVVGFAAESVHSQEELAQLSQKKLNSKNADMIVGNNVADAFATLDNKVYVADCFGREEHWQKLPKTEIAWNILTWLSSL